MQAVQNMLRVAVAKCGEGSAERAALSPPQRLPSPLLEQQAPLRMALVAPREPTPSPQVAQWLAPAKPKALGLALRFPRAQVEAVEQRR